MPTDQAPTAEDKQIDDGLTVWAEGRVGITEHSLKTRAKAAELSSKESIDSIKPTNQVHVESLTPTDRPEWERYINLHRHGTLFHRLSWHDSVASSFNHEPVYLIARSQDKVVGVLPMFLIRSRLTGRRLVSVPYGVGGGILADSIYVVTALAEEAKRVSRDEQCSVIELRNEYSEHNVVPDWPAVEGYFGFQRPLPDRVEDVLNRLPRKARAAARQARHKYGLTADIGDEHLKEVWRLYAQSMRRLGSINYPYAFFEQILAHTPHHHWTMLIRRRGEPVAGLITFLFKDCVMPYFAGSNDNAKVCRAANFMYLTAMEMGVERGYRTFDFGRSRLDNRGSFDFKRFHGFEPRPLHYQRFAANGRTVPDLSPSNPQIRLARAVWKYLPLPVTQALGAHLSWHIPG